MTPSPHTLRTGNTWKALVLVWSVLVTAAFAAPVNFDIPAQPAPDALQLFIKQSGTQVAYGKGDLQAVSTKAVKGAFEPAAALGLMLKDTGYTAAERRAGWFSIVRIEAAKPGSVDGSVRDEAGKPVAGAKVTLADSDHAVLTDKRGRFSIAGVTAGAHVLQITAEGLQNTRVTDVEVKAGQQHSLGPITIPGRKEGTLRLDDFVVSAKKNDGVIELDPYSVEGQRGKPVAGGNLDLPRTENDALPFTVFSHEEIARSGVTNLTDYLRRELLETDAVTLPAGIDNTNSFNYAAPAGSTLNLRGFGTDETVVLVNGRRLPNTQVQNTRYPADLNTVPLSMIERIEILPAAASAIYGDNAVGGVINIVLRPNVQATEVTLTHNNSFAFDAPQSSVSLVHGQNLFDGRLNVRFSATFNRTEPVREGELGYLTAVNERTVKASPPGASAFVWGATPNVRSSDGTPLFGPGTPSYASVIPGSKGTEGLGMFTGRQGVWNLDLYDAPGGSANFVGKDFAYDRPVRQEIYTAALLYRPWPRFEISLDGSYSGSRSNFGTPILRSATTVPANSPFNPFGKPVMVLWQESLPDDAGNRSRWMSSSLALGLLFKVTDNWTLTLDGQYAENRSHSRFAYPGATSRTEALIAQGVINPFRDTQLSPPPAEIYATIPVNDEHDLGFNTAEAILRLANQALALPTGTGTLVVGATFRKNDSENYASSYRYPDGTVQTENSYLLNRMDEQQGAFVEARAPLLAKSWLPRGVTAVEGDLGWRYVRSDTFKRSPNPPTLGLKIDVAGGLTLRGSYTTAYKPPTAEMSVPVTEAVPTSTTITDPRRGGERYAILQDRSANPDLVPEDGTTRTVGLIFQRGRTHQVRLAVDYNDTQKINELSFQSSSSLILLEEYFPDRIERAAPTPGDTFNVGRVARIRAGYVNIAETRAKSWSGQARYSWTECLGGTLDLTARVNWFESFTTQVLPNSAVIENIDNPDAPLFGLLKYRGSFGAAWSVRDWGFGADGRYYHALMLPRFNWAAQGGERVDKYWEFDLHAHADLTRWLPWKESRYRLRGQVRVNNVLGTDFPFNATNNYGVQPYGDWRGRMYSLSLSASF